MSKHHSQRWTESVAEASDRGDDAGKLLCGNLRPPMRRQAAVQKGASFTCKQNKTCYFEIETIKCLKFHDNRDQVSLNISRRDPPPHTPYSSYAISTIQSKCQEQKVIQKSHPQIQLILYLTPSKHQFQVSSQSPEKLQIKSSAISIPDHHPTLAATNPP